MLKARLLLITGVWTAVLPYLGFPKNIKNVLFVLTGFFLVYISLVVYKQTKTSKKESKTKSFESFSENRDFVENNF